MLSILIVDDNGTVVAQLSSMLAKNLDCIVHVAYNYKQALAMMQERMFDLALLDLNLPDADDGAILAPARELRIPIIVLTSLQEKKIREDIVSAGVVDYLLKDSSDDIRYLIDRIRLLEKTRGTTILVVDDSSMQRAIMRRHLQAAQYRVIEAKNGVEAIKILEDDPAIRLVVTDYHMPEMDGYKLVRHLRETYPQSKLSTLVLSSNSAKDVTLKFLRLGVTDFIEKPFQKEEFLCRVNNAIQSLLHLDTIQELAQKDYLTGLLNRRSFFERSEALLKKGGESIITLAIIDFDHFKKINDTYGHSVGDEVLKNFSETVRSIIGGEHLISRLGGEEFGILFIDQSTKNTLQLIRKLCESVNKARIFIDKDRDIGYSISVGTSVWKGETLHELMQKADERLYTAKDTGRGRVVHE